MTSSSSRIGRRPGKKSTAGIALACLAAIYTFLVPVVNDRFGWNLPQISERDGRQAVVQETTSSKSSNPQSTKSSENTKQTTASSSPSKPGIDVSKKSSTAESKRGPLADRKTTAGTSADQKRSPATTKSNGGDANLRYGLLRDLGNERYLSPSGLLYTRGSVEGHRLKHLERHTKDIPNRPGSHGVFDGGMEGALKTIEKAYERAKKKQRTTVTQDKERTIYVVDLGSRIGFVGGQSGRRKRNPMARRVQLVLEGKRVITAYPK